MNYWFYLIDQQWILKCNSYNDIVVPRKNHHKKISMALLAKQVLNPFTLLCYKVLTLGSNILKPFISTYQLDLQPIYK